VTTTAVRTFLASPMLWAVAVVTLAITWTGLLLANAYARDGLDEAITVSLSLRDVAVLFGIWTSTLVVVMM
jgi:hypothetical protein